MSAPADIPLDFLCNVSIGVGTESRGLEAGAALIDQSARAVGGGRGMVPLWKGTTHE